MWNLNFKLLEYNNLRISMQYMFFSIFIIRKYNQAIKK